MRLADPTATGSPGAIGDLEVLADLYFQTDSYEPALETLEALLALPDAGDLSPAHRRTLDLKRAVILRRQGRFTDALDSFGTMLEKEEEALPRALRAMIALEGAQLLSRLTRYDEALDLARRAVTLAEAEGDRALLARALGRLGAVHLRRGDMLLSRESFEEALALFRRIGDDANVAWTRGNLGVVCKNLCEWDAARSHFLEALAIHRRLGEEAQVAFDLQNLGVLLVKSGQWSRARETLAEAQTSFTRVGNRWGVVINTLARGWLTRLEGRLDEAETLLAGALDTSLADGFHREEALSREFLGDIAFDRGLFDRAFELYRAALALGERQAPAGDIVSEVLRRIAETEVRRGHLDNANTALERALHVCALLDDRYENAVLQRVRGQVATARGERDEAESALRAAVNLFGEMGERFERGKALTLLAEVTTDPAETRKLLYRASACFAEIGAERELSIVEHKLAESGSLASAERGRNGRVVEDSTGRLRGRKIATPALVGPSRSMQRMLDLVGRAAATDLSVLLIGETGTGKELVARAIHTGSRRADKPFLAVNCGALRVELALSQLFGHRRGAFTGAHADGVGFVEAAHLGTLFLDEVGELPADVQVTLLRFLESGEYLRLGETQVRRADVRIVCATHVDLRRAVAAKTFRADLFYRLHEIEIELPPLRERPEDILPLARHFLRAYGGDHAPDLDDDAMKALLDHAWPGNVRELENCVKRALALLPVGCETVTGDAVRDMLDRSPEVREARGDSVGVRAGSALRAQLLEADRREILEALEDAAGNKSRAAEHLGVSRKTLYARMRRLGLEVD